MSSYEPSSSWQSRLPGTPGGPQAPSWSTPEGLYQYILSNVPGISPEAAAWMHGQILGGQSFLNGPFSSGGQSMLATPYGQQAPAAQGSPYLTAEQAAAINALAPFSGGAGSSQPHYPGDPVPPASAGPGMGGSLNPVQPLQPRPGPSSGGNLNPPAAPSPGARPPHQPPGENQTVYATNMPGPSGRYPQPVRPPAGGIDFGNYGPPVTNINDPSTGPYPLIGPGAHLAESALGTYQNDPFDAVTSPVKYLGRHKYPQF